jgi:hypothetical protein
MPDPYGAPGRPAEYVPYTVGQLVTGQNNQEIPRGNGIVLALSETRFAQITDGAASTILFGEKHIAVSDHALAETAGDDRGWDQGFDVDINRWTLLPPFPDESTNLDATRAPGAIGNPDNPTDPLGFLYEFSVFGGAHPVGCQFVYADGSVHTINYDVDAQMFRGLGSIAEGEIIVHP